MDSITRRRELAAFLRSCRQRLDPREQGFELGRRRVPGLRREEVAAIAGVSLSWYTWLEQAREIRASADVMCAIARALSLDPAEREYLLRLSGHVPLAPPDADRPDPHADPELQALTDGFRPNPVSIVTPGLDYVAWNRASEQIVPGFLGCGDGKHNLVRFLLGGGVAGSGVDLPELDLRAWAARLRRSAARHPDDPALAELIEELQDTNREFARLWGLHEVGPAGSPPEVAFGHPAGPLRFRQLHLTPDSYPELTVVVFLPADEPTALRLGELSDESPVAPLRPV